MMLRYHESEEETTKAIVYDSDGKRWYNTGDLAIKLENGEYRYIGRKKRNFVCGVDNIYPEQIESLLLQIDDILEIAVTKVPDKKMQYLPKYHLRLKSPSRDKKQVEDDIANMVRRTLGESALPGYIIYYDQPLPRTDNGKIDFKKLEIMEG